MRQFRILWLVSAGAAVCFAASPAIAASGTTTLTYQVQATVIGGCTVNATPLTWIVPAPATVSIDTTASVTVRCPPNTAFTVEIDNGLYNQGINRRVRNAPANAYLRYQVYRNAARSQRWGATPATDLSGNTGATGIALLTAYGRLSALASMPAGGYSDTLTVTVNF